MATKKSPLAGFQQLSPGASYFEPSPSTTTTISASSTSPKLIIIFSWFGAAPSHIAKYISVYRETHPSSSILLIQSRAPHIFFQSMILSDIRPALPVIQKLAPLSNPENSSTKNGKKPEVLIHVFSNGGLACAVRMLQLCRDSVKDKVGVDASDAVPVHSLIVDSAPGYYHYTSAMAAISLAFPSWFLPFLHIAMCISWLTQVPFGIKLQPDYYASELNSDGFVKLLLPGVQPRRTHIYGGSDPMVLWQDVEKNAAEARGKGWEVRLERFKEGKHVANMRAEPERYWRVVRETWESR